MINLDLPGGQRVMVEEPASMNALRARVVWRLTDYLEEKREFSLLEQIGRQGTLQEIERLESFANRDPRSLMEAQINVIVGRSLIAPKITEAARFGGQPYAHVELSGFGKQNFVPLQGDMQHLKSIDLNSPVEIPGATNYYDSQPGVAASTSVAEGKLVPHYESYAPEGAYTLGQAAEKIGLTMAAFLAARRRYFKALTPLPLCAGIYDGIDLPEGKAWFIGHSVPYAGARSGQIFDNLSAGDLVKRQQAQVSKAAAAARIIHNELKVVHGSFIFGNMQVDDVSKPPYIADWATAQAFDLKKGPESLWRAVDLGAPLSTWLKTVARMTPEVSGTSQFDVVLSSTVFSVLEKYLDIKIPAKSLPFPKNVSPESFSHIASEALAMGMKDFRFPRDFTTGFNFELANNLAAHIRKQAAEQGLS